MELLDRRSFLEALGIGATGLVILVIADWLTAAGRLPNR